MCTPPINRRSQGPGDMAKRASGRITQSRFDRHLGYYILIKVSLTYLKVRIPINQKTEQTEHHEFVKATHPIAKLRDSQWGEAGDR